MKTINKRIIAIITLGTVLTFSNIANAKTFNEVSSTASSQNSKLQEALKNIGIELYPAKKCWITNVNDTVDVNGIPIEDYTTYYVDDYINPTVVYEWNDSNESFSKVNKNCYIIPHEEPFHFIGFPKDQLVIGYKDATPDLPKDQTHIIIPILEDTWTNHCKRYNKNPLRADYYLDANNENAYYSGYVNNYLNPTETYRKDKNDGTLIINNNVAKIFSSDISYYKINKKLYKFLGWKDTTPDLPSSEVHKIVAVTENFPEAAYCIGNKCFAIAYVDNLENPTKAWNDVLNKDAPLKDFKNINDDCDDSSNPEDYVPKGYVFKGWKVRGYDDEYEATVVDAILEKDQDFIDKMETSVDFSLDDSVSESYRPVCVKYNDEISKPVSIKVLVTSDNGIFKSENIITTDEKYRGYFKSGYTFEEDLTKDVCVFCTCNLSILPGNYTVKVEVTNDLGKVTTAEKTYADKELTKLVDPNSVYLADASKEYYFGDKVYLTNVTKGNSWFIDNLQHDENGYYLVADANFISHYSYGAVANEPDYDPSTQVWTLTGNFGAVCTRALKVHNISRDGKSVAFGELPKQEEPEVPVEPATKTPEEIKPAEQATKTPEETKPSKPSNTSDASNVAVALVGLTLTGAVVIKTKKNA